MDFRLLVSGSLAKSSNKVTDEMTVTSRCAPFVLVKVQKGLLHRSHVKRGQTIFFASFLFIIPLTPTTSLGQLLGFLSLLIIPGTLCSSPRYVVDLRCGSNS